MVAHVFGAWVRVKQGKKAKTVYFLPKGHNSPFFHNKLGLVSGFLAPLEKDWLEASVA